jgi:flavin-binding protein dodecin
MSVAKVIEISARSESSIEDAVERGIRKASETVDNIKSAWIKETHAEVENGTVSGYRVLLKITFVLGG